MARDLTKCLTGVESAWGCSASPESLMSQPKGQKPAAPASRKQTPRVPSNVLYDWVVPIILFVVLIVLVLIVVVVIASLLAGGGAGYL